MNPKEQAKRTKAWLLEDGELEDFAPISREFVKLAVDRINTDGAQQYYDEVADRMRFEIMDVEDLFQYAEEEALDLANYAYMLYARTEGVEALEDAARLLADLAFDSWYQARMSRESWAALQNGKLGLRLIGQSHLGSVIDSFEATP